MLSRNDLATIFNPPLTVESRIKQAIPTLFEVEDEDKDNRFTPYKWDFKGYCKDILDSTPWSMQLEIADAYILALRQQHEKMAFENGELPLDDLEYWQPGQVIQNWIAIDAGHTSGKTFLIAKLVSHFFDCFPPSITYCFAPSSEQINDLLFKEIRVDRRDRDLPGFVFPRDTRIKYKADHFVTGRATNNANSTGTERIHGQHGKFLLFVLDESEAIPDFVWDSVQSMTSGGISIVVSARNPRTTTCRAHSIRSLPKTAEFTISCLDVPNVVEGREVVPNLAQRDYVLDMLEHTEVVSQHNPDDHTFELSWDPGTIYKPAQEFCWRVLGIAEENEALNTFCPYGRFDAAVERGKQTPFEFTDEHERATIGVDAARFGDDFGTVWIRRGDWLWRTGNFQSSDSFTFYNHIKSEMRKLVSDGVVDIEIRVDAGGGWGAGVIDLLNHDLDLQRLQIIQDELNEWNNLLEFRVYEVNFDGVSSKPADYYNLVTEMYYCLGEAMKVLYLRDAPKTLRADLCKREYDYGMKAGRSVKVLTPKKKFKAVHNRSPDDGDGAALAAAPKQMFKIKPLLLHAG